MTIVSSDFDKIRNSIELTEGNSIELIFFNSDLENRYFDEEKEDYVKIEANLLEMLFDDYTVKILNKNGLTDESLRKLYSEGNCLPCNIVQDNRYYDASYFSIDIEIEELDMPDVVNPLQQSIF